MKVPGSTQIISRRTVELSSAVCVCLPLHHIDRAGNACLVTGSVTYGVGKGVSARGIHIHRPLTVISAVILPSRTSCASTPGSTQGVSLQVRDVGIPEDLHFGAGHIRRNLLETDTEAYVEAAGVGVVAVAVG